MDYKTVMIEAIDSKPNQISSNEIFKSFIENSFQGYLIYLDNRIVFANKALSQMTGYTIEELLEKNNPFMELIHPDDIEKVNQRINALKEEKLHPYRYQFRLMNKNGSIRWIEASTKKFALENKPAYQSIFVDITQKKIAEQVCDQNSKRLSIINDIGHSILTTESPESIAQSVVKRVSILIPCQWAMIYLFDNDPTVRRLITSTHLDKKSTDIVLQSFDRIMLTESKYKTGKAFFVPPLNSTEQPFITFNDLKKIGMSSAIGTYLVSNRQILGFFLLASPETGVFTEEYGSIVEELAIYLIAAIVQARLLDEERLRRQEAEMLREASAAIVSVVNPGQVLDNILRQLAKVISYDSASIVLRGSDDSLWVVAGRGLPDSSKIIGKGISFSSRILDQIQQEKKTLILDDVGQDTRFNLVNGLGYIRGWMGIPLIMRGEVIGFLTVDNRKPTAFSDNDAAMAQAYANQAAVAIDNAQLFETLEERVNDRTRILSVLYKIAEIASESTDINHILEKSLETTLEKMHRDRGCIHLLDKEKQLFKLNVYRGIPARMLAKLETVPINFGLSSLVYAHRMPIFSNNMVTDPRSILYNVKGIEAWTFLSVPLVVRDNFLGTISIYGDIGQPNDSEDSVLLRTIADQIAVAVENAQLREQASLAAVVEERDRLARDIHDSVTQSIYSLALNADTSIKLLNIGNFKRLAATLTDTKESAFQALKEMRLLLHELRPDFLGKKGLVEALKHRLDAVEQRSGMVVKFSTEGSINIAKELESELYRVIEEALNNTLKHSAASQVNVKIRGDKDFIEFEIIDNGKGADLENVGYGGMGLRNMRERIDAIGGKLELTTALGEGMRIHCFVDLRDKIWKK